MTDKAELLVEDSDHGIVYKIRPMDGEEDEGVVYNAWCNQIRKLPPFREMGREEFAAHKRKVIEDIVARCGVRFAVHPDHTDQVFGWIRGEKQEDDHVLHFVYVRGIFRQAGIGTTLMRVEFPFFGKRTIYNGS